MTLLLAPMEGLLDHTLRDVLTRAGGIERCVSEFIRVTGTLLPERVFTRIVPELLNGGRTPAGVPVRAQLMGSDPQCLAENAARLAGLGPAGIDLNFGCPAKVVNRHGGGAALLQDPELLTRIVSAVRRAVPAGMPVSAKMRLGYADDSRAEDCAQAIEAGGASELVVHARTKVHGYRPPAYWERVADVRRAVRLPVVANGEIWSVADARRCRELSGCEALMLGRGMVCDPGLALAILADRVAPDPAGAPGSASSAHAPATSGAGLPVPGLPVLTAPGLPWSALLPLIEAFWQRVERHIEPRAQAGRLKQWLNLLRRRHPEAEAAFQMLRTVDDPAAVARWVRGLVGPRPAPYFAP